MARLSSLLAVVVVVGVGRLGLFGVASAVEKKETYMYRYPVLLKPGRQIGIQFSPPPALTLPASKSMLKIRCKSPGCSECFLGLTTLTRLPAATIRP